MRLAGQEFITPAPLPMAHPILIGTAGWNYPDWRGVVYPVKRPRGFSELAFLADYFPVIEINSTFYAVPSLKTVEQWLRTVARRSGFRFCVKLWQGCTHGESLDQAATFRERLQPMIDCDRLAALLIQFPWSFKRSPATVDRLQQILDAMNGLPCAIEFRHASWQNSQTLGLLRERSAAFVNIDQPVIGESVAPSSWVTAPFAYVRLHGRSADNWFRDGAGRDARYDYLYTPEEIHSWSEKIQSMSQAVPVMVIFNNHFRGQAVVNAFQLEYRLTGKRPPVPPPLLARYPQLVTQAASAEKTGTWELF